MLKKTILFSSAGRRVELIQCFRNAAKELNLKLEVLAIDLDPAMSAACAHADRSFSVPRCTTPAYIERLLEICEKERVSLVVPTIDTELEVLSLHQQEFAKIGTRIVVSSPEVIRMTRNKADTAAFLTSFGILVPRTDSIDRLLSHQSEWRWPVTLKPVAGSCSVGLHIVSNPESIRGLDIERSGYIAQELWRGKEYTVNLFFDSNGELKCAVPHWRRETRGGEVSKGITERVPVLMDIAEKLGTALQAKAFGPLCFQAIINELGQAAVFEINARLGGGYPLADRAGATFAKWLLEETAGLPSTAHNNWQEGVTMLRYDAAVFLESVSN